MALKAKLPQPSETRAKIFIFGEPGTKKTRTTGQFPFSYHFDTEGGASNYGPLFEESKSVVLKTSDVDEVIGELRELRTTKHPYRTVTIDPITPLESDLNEKSENEFGAGDMRIWAKRYRVLKRLVNILTNIDMNVLVTSHAKPEYGENMRKLGTTFDAWKRWPYVFDLCLQVELRGGKSIAIVRKTRLEKFPMGDTFDFSYEAIRDRYGKLIIERDATPAELASHEQVELLEKLLEAVVLPEGTASKWLNAAGVETWEEMNSRQIAGCIENVRKRLPKESA